MSASTYPVSEVAAKYGASVTAPTDEPGEAYADTPGHASGEAGLAAPMTPLELLVVHSDDLGITSAAGIPPGRVTRWRWR